MTDNKDILRDDDEKRAKYKVFRDRDPLLKSRFKM